VGAYSAPPGSYLYLWGLLLRGGRGKTDGKERGREEEGEVRGGNGRGQPSHKYFGLEAPLHNPLKTAVVTQDHGAANNHSAMITEIVIP